MQHYEIKFVTCNRSVVLTGCSGFPHQYNSPPWHNWTIVESGITHHKQNKTKTLFTTVNFSLIGSNIPTVSAYRNYISQLLPYLSGYTHWWFVTTPTLSEWLHTLVICYNSYLIWVVTHTGDLLQLLPYLSGYTHWWFVTTPTLSEWLHTLAICYNSYLILVVTHTGDLLQLLPYLSGYTHWWFVTTPILS
jgi:hypothetical protein